MCNRFIEDFVNKVIEKNTQWLWIYNSDQDELKFLLIYAFDKKEAILKLRNTIYTLNMFNHDTSNV